MLREILAGAPAPRVVDDDRVPDAVLRVITFLRAVGVDQMDEIAVDDESVLFLVDEHLAREGTVDRVAGRRPTASRRTTGNSATCRRSTPSLRQMLIRS